MDIFTSLLSAFGLSTAAGLNAYIPLLVVGLMSRYTNLIELNAPYNMLSNPIVLVVIAVLALLDFIGDKIPTVDHVLHMAGLIIHPVAGAILFMAANSATGSVDPVLAAICGLILAGGTHGVRATARPLATATTAGIANPVVSFFEDSLSLILSVMAILVPALAVVVIVICAVLVAILLRRLFQRRRQTRRSWRP